MLTPVVSVSSKHPETDRINQAAQAIKEGKLVVFPTETVYGIAANVLSSDALERLYLIKGRSKEKPLTWHIADISQLRDRIGNLSAVLEKLIQTFWPGPLTLVLSCGKEETIGFRMPAHPVALALIRAAQVPIVAPSANLSGMSPPSTVQEALKDLDGKVDLALDGGKTSLGIASTVLDLSGETPHILREGAIKAESLMHWFEENPWKK